MLFEAILAGAGISMLGTRGAGLAAKGVGKLTGKVFSGIMGIAKAAGKGIPLLSAAAERFPKVYGVAGGLATGFALNQLTSALGGVTQSAIRSYYGDSPVAANINNMLGTASTIGSYVVGAALFNSPAILRSIRGNPSATLNWMKSSVQGLKSAGVPGIISSTGQGLYDVSKGSINALRGTFTAKNPFVLKHPFIAATAVGAAAGGAASIISRRRPYGGDITRPQMMPMSAVQSSPTGGISPNLQLSTMGLPLRIHNRSSTRRL